MSFATAARNVSLDVSTLGELAGLVPRDRIADVLMAYCEAIGAREKRLAAEASRDAPDFGTEVDLCESKPGSEISVNSSASSGRAQKRARWRANRARRVVDEVQEVVIGDNDGGPTYSDISVASADDGYCYTRLFADPIAAAAEFGGFPTFSQILCGKAKFKPPEALADVGVSRISPGLYHVGVSGPSALGTLAMLSLDLIPATQFKGVKFPDQLRGKIGLNDRVGASRCALLGVGNLASDLCHECSTVQNMPWHHTEWGTVECSAVKVSRQVRRNEVPILLVTRPDIVEEDLRGPVVRSANCVDPAVGQEVCAFSPMVQVFVPVGYVLDVQGYILDTRSQSVSLLVVDGMRFVVLGKPEVGHIGLRRGDRRDKVRWLHKYVGEDPCNTFSRFLERTSSGMCWMPMRAAGMSRPSVPECGEGEIPGTSVEVCENSFKVLPIAQFGTTVEAIHGEWWLYSAAAYDGARLRVKPGQSVSLPRDTGVVVADRGELELGGTRLDITYGIDDYALDDGGPSDDEYDSGYWFSPEY